MPRIIPCTSLADSVLYLQVNCSSQTEDDKIPRECHSLPHALYAANMLWGGGYTDIQNLEEMPKIKLKLKRLISSCIEKKGFLKPRTSSQHYTHTSLSSATNTTPQSCDPPSSVEDKTMQNTELEMITRFKEKTNQHWHFC